MSSHSPLPCKVEIGAFVYVLDVRGEIVGIIDTEEQAHGIVRACNSYPALMELLMHIRDDRSAYQWHEAIDEALNLAESKK